MTHATSQPISRLCADAIGRALLAGAAAWLLHAPLAAAQTAPAHPVPPAAAAPADDGQWSMPAKNYAATRYSGLNEINGDTVKHLGVAFTFSTGVVKGQEAAPIVVNNTMFVVTAYPNIVYALDLTKPGAPLKWIYKPHPEPASQGVACCDVVNRGAVFWDGKIIFNTLDGNTIALDANDGKLLWKTKLADINMGETITMAPLVVKGKVLVGDSGGEMGVRGWLAALDASNGKLVWKAYSTGPDKDVLIGADFHPFYPSDKGQGPRRQHLAAGGMEDRRRHGVGLDRLRSRPQPDFLRHRQSRSVEPGAAARRQQMDDHVVRAGSRHGRRQMGAAIQPA